MPPIYIIGFITLAFYFFYIEISIYFFKIKVLYILKAIIN